LPETFSKRQKEKNRQEKQREKEARRYQKRSIPKDKPGEGSATEDPDIAGIVPGPQPPVEW